MKAKRRRQNERAQVVKTLAAAGLSADVISATLKIGRDRLRSDHAIALHSGRTARKAAEARARAEALSPAEAAQLERIKMAFAVDPAFASDIYGGAMSVAAAQDYCRRFKRAHKPNEVENGSSD
jgi:hypothetical protein